MISFSKQKKHSKVLDVKQSKDMITNLPSCLITKIISCLPTKDAVATSVLATKWKRLWTSVTSLDFDFQSSFDSFDCDSPFYKNIRSSINQVMLLRDKSCLERFSLQHYRDYDHSLVNAWLIAAVQCNVQELDIFFSLNHPGLLPSDIFRCSTLVVCKLYVIGPYYMMPTSTCLPSLTTLHINGVQFPHDDFITRILSGCPKLEELSLCNCIGKDVRVVKIIAPFLKNLILKVLPYEWWNEDEDSLNYQIVIDTPTLEFFTFDDFRFLRIQLVKTMDYLIKAMIYLRGTEMYSVRADHCQAFKDFVNGISHVENLDIYWDLELLEDISWGNFCLPEFRNLTYLKFNSMGGSGWFLLPKLLMNSPCLKTLYVIQDDVSYEKETLDDSPFNGVPFCVLFSLKDIEIQNFGYCEWEMEFVEYILKNAKGLEKLTLDCTKSSNDSCKDDPEFLKALLSLPRASSTCKVVVL